MRLMAFWFLLVVFSTYVARADDPTPTAPFRAWADNTCDPGSIPYTGYAPRGFDHIVKLTLVLAKKTVGSKTVYYLDPTAPIKQLYAGQQLVVEVTPDQFDQDVPLVAIGFQSAAATPINVAPVRSTQSSERKKLEQSVCSSIVVQADTTVTVTVWGVLSSDGSTAQVFTSSLPQVHALDFFNISTGIVASTLRDNTFTRVIKTPSDPTKTPPLPATFTTTQGKTGQRVAPALFFTWYFFRPLDPEVPYQRSDSIPEPTVGFSLTNPGSDYFFGASSEFLVRGVQLVYGFHYGKITELTPNQVDDPFSSAAQATQQKFVGKAFIGATFNIDFIKRVFGK